MPEQVATKTLQLPCGLGPDKEGRIQREAEIAPMTGLVRKNIARPEIRSNFGKVVDAVLLPCLKRVGTIEKVDRRVLDKLLTGDRDFLLLEIRKLSLNEKVRATMKCGACNEKVDITFDLTKVPVRRLPDKGDGIEIVGTERVFTIDWTFVDERASFTAKFRFPNGADQIEAAQLSTRNPVEANYKMYGRCLHEWNGQPATQVSPTLFDDLPLPILDQIDRAFRERMPGPDLDQPVTCALCGEDNRLDLSTSDFLFPAARERTQNA